MCARKNSFFYLLDNGKKSEMCTTVIPEKMASRNKINLNKTEPSSK